MANKITSLKTGKPNRTTRKMKWMKIMMTIKIGLWKDLKKLMPATCKTNNTLKKANLIIKLFKKTIFLSLLMKTNYFMKTSQMPI